MSGIYGVLGLADNERVFLSTLGQGVIYDAVNEYLAFHNEELARTLSVFVDETTSDHKRRYMLPGGGRLQNMGFNPQAAPAVTKAYGSWDVAFPLYDFGAGQSTSRVSGAYATTQDLQRHLDNIRQQDINTVRFEIVNALLGSTQTSFVDPNWGTLLIEPLANSDTVVYPPVLGSETEVTDNHYLESGYATASISDTNNPYVTIVAELEEHFGAPTGGSNIVTFINNAETAKTQALTDFVSVTDMRINPGDDTATITGLPAGVPGRVLGAVSGTWVVEWRHLPAMYMVAIHMDAPKPLVMRVDPDYTGLAGGLQLVANSDKTPFTNSFYSHRFGIGAGNRINGVVMEMGTGGTYSVPTGYL